MQGTIGIFYFLVLIFSIMVHEVMHGLIAEREGDSTARMQGRITLNPLKHIDWIGSVILPLLLIISNAGFVVGWAKPVPYDPQNVRNGKKSVAKIAAAGPLINLAIAVVFSLCIRVLALSGVMLPSLYDILSIIVIVNLVLTFFNILPFAPLDGFTIIFSLLPPRYDKMLRTLTLISLPLLIIFLLFGWKYVVPEIFKFYSVLTGIAI